MVLVSTVSSFTDLDLRLTLFQLGYSSENGWYDFVEVLAGALLSQVLFAPWFYLSLVLSIAGSNHVSRVLTLALNRDTELTAF